METNIVKETLNETLNKIRSDWGKRSTEIQEDLSNKLRSILNNEVFDGFNFHIDKNRIEFLSKEKKWMVFILYLP